MKLGNVATGKDFFDRKFVREDIWQYLEDNNLVLRGVRRLGKSSILKKIEEEASEKGLYAAYKDVGGAASADVFIEFLEEALPDKTISAFFKKKSKLALSWIERAKIKVKVPDAGEAELSLKEAKKYSWYTQAIKF